MRGRGLLRDVRVLRIVQIGIGGSAHGVLLKQQVQVGRKAEDQVCVHI